MLDVDDPADTARLLSPTSSQEDGHARAPTRTARRGVLSGVILLATALVVGVASFAGRTKAVVASSDGVSLFGLPPPPAFGLPSLPFAQQPQAGNNPALRQPQAPPATGPEEMNFHMFRAGSDVSYPLENVNTASLEGVMWYLHSEVVTSAPRKYGIDRIRRYEVRVKNTQEYWNVHKKQFGPFMAFDAGKCTTTDNGQDICGEIYNKYGFLVGCQTVSGTAAYYADQATTTACQPGSVDCNLPLWFSLPGECPQFGIPQDIIDANSANQDVGSYKTLDCRMRMPGGMCEQATGSPDCTFSVWPAGEVYLDELIGIQNYNVWWNTSYEACMGRVNKGLETGPCVKNYEYVVETDAGVGTSFWDGILDPAACKARTDAVKALFEQKYPGVPAANPAPTCDFDMLYDQEMTWPVNHDKAPPSEWWNYKDGAAPVPTPVQAAFNTPAPAAVVEPNPNEPAPPPAPVPAPTLEPGYVDPACADPAYADPILCATPNAADPAYADPNVDPNSAQAAYPDPNAAQAAYPDPNSAQAAYLDPNAAQAAYPDPNAAQAAYPDPNAAQSAYPAQPVDPSQAAAQAAVAGYPAPAVAGYPAPAEAGYPAPAPEVPEAAAAPDAGAFYPGYPAPAPAPEYR